MREKTQRREVVLKLPKKRDICYVDLSSGECFEDEGMEREILSKNPVELRLALPEKIETVEVHKASLPPIIEMSVNRKVWPMEDAIGLKLFLDNREINMISEGKYRQNKYRALFHAVTWKRWVLLVYNFKNGSTRSILWWKNFE